MLETRGARERGLSLVEVLVAVAILVTGAMAVAQLFVLATASTTAARDATYAAVLATQKLEELIAQPGQPGAVADVDYVDPLGHAVLPGDAAYTRRWSIAQVAGDPTGSLVLIQVEVARRTGADIVRFFTVRSVQAP